MNNTYGGLLSTWTSRRYSGPGIRRSPGRTSGLTLNDLSFKASLHLHQQRSIHTSVSRLDLEDKSKVERTVEALKESKTSQTALSAASKETLPLEAPKKTLWQKVVAECKHYYHGFRLLAAETRISWGLLRKLSRGESLSRREHKQVCLRVCALWSVLWIQGIVFAAGADSLRYISSGTVCGHSDYPFRRVRLAGSSKVLP